MRAYALRICLRANCGFPWNKDTTTCFNDKETFVIDVQVKYISLAIVTACKSLNGREMYCSCVFDVSNEFREREQIKDLSIVNGPDHLRSFRRPPLASLLSISFGVLWIFTQCSDKYFLLFQSAFGLLQQTVLSVTISILQISQADNRLRS